MSETWLDLRNGEWIVELEKTYEVQQIGLSP